MKNTKELIDALPAGEPARRWRNLRVASGRQARASGRGSYWFRDAMPKFIDVAAPNPRALPAHWYEKTREDVQRREGETDTQFYVREWTAKNFLK